MKNIEKYLSLAMLLFAVGFNLWLYRLEPTVKVDPNDNPFQYALVERTNQIWDFADRTCPILTSIPCHLSLLVDHWVPNWAQGYNLPYYYSHVPQIVIVASYRTFHLVSPLSLFQYYHWVIYLLLCLFPISMFFALRAANRSWTAAGIGALIASQLSTDGLYGLDPSSFLWRGYGLSSQLFAMIFLPLAIAYSYRFFMTEKPGGGQQFFEELKFWLRQITGRPALPKLHLVSPSKEPSTAKEAGRTSSKNSWPSSNGGIFWLAILFLVLATMGHLGLGIMALLSAAIFAASGPIWLLLTQSRTKEILQSAKMDSLRLVLLGTVVVFFLSYWIVPILLGGNYHNNSFWDPIWKFNSYPWQETLTRLFNGDLFDFGRLPILTALIFLGVFVSLRSGTLFPFALLFAGWLLLYFGRTTWGGLIDLIPSMRDFHLSRFIVGLHVSGLFLATLAVEWFVEFVTNLASKYFDIHHTAAKAMSRTSALLLVSIALVLVIMPQTIHYSEFNDTLIKRSNTKVTQQWADAQALIDTLKKLPPGRIFAGRGGAWGKQLQISETPYFMHLSTYGLPTILWLPETWSPNSDTEQYFIEERPELYDLYNIKYVVTPQEIKPQAFWRLLRENKAWKLYEVKTGGYMTTGSHVAVVHSNKDNFINVVRLWIQSDIPKKSWFPSLSFGKLAVNEYHLPAFGMTDEATYKTLDGQQFSLFGNIPSYLGDEHKITFVGSQVDDSDMVFTGTVNVPDDCKNCLVILKQTYHPNWKAYVDGRKTDTLTVFPFYTAIRLNEAGTHTVRFAYEPSGLKQILLFVALTVLFALVVSAFWQARHHGPGTFKA